MGTRAGSAWGDLGSCHPFLHLPATQLLLTIGMRSQTPHLFTFPGGWEQPLPSQVQAALGQGRMVEKSSPQILTLRFPPVPAPRGDLAVSFSPPSPQLPGSASREGMSTHSQDPQWGCPSLSLETSGKGEQKCSAAALWSLAPPPRRAFHTTHSLF